MSVDETRARLERRIDRLPVLPTVVARLMVLDRDDDGYFEEVLALIEADAAFASRILAAANSAESSPTDPVRSVRMALARLGGQGAAGAVMAAAISEVFVPRDPWEKSLWRHALHVAGAMRALVALDPTCPFDGDVAYAAGLLHDVGRIVMFHHDPDTLRSVDEGDWDSPQTLVEAEMRICGVTHAELGARACRRWKLPDLLVEAVALHHHPEAPLAGAAGVMVAMTRFADLAMFPSALPGTPGRETHDATIESELIPRLPANLAGVTVAQLRALIGDTATWAQATADSLGIG